MVASVRLMGLEVSLATVLTTTKVHDAKLKRPVQMNPASLEVPVPRIQLMALVVVVLSI